MTVAIRPNQLVVAIASLFAISIIAGLSLKTNSSDWFMETSGDAGLVLTDLEISGLAQTTENDVLSVLDVDSGMPLLSINLADIQNKLEALPWVKQAEVMRVLPGGLSINIIERIPYALAQYNGKVALIDRDGVEITDRGLAAYSNLMLLVGKVPSQALEQLEEQKAKAGSLAGRIRSVVRVGNRRWDVIFDNGIRVKFPADDAKPYGAPEAWNKFIELDRTQQLLEREVTVVDLRLADKVIVRVTPTGRRQMSAKEWVL